MIAVDTNILVYAHREDSNFFKLANDRLVNLAESGQAWAIPWPCLHEFLSIVTHPKIYRPPTPLKTAMAQIQAWLDCPTLHLLSEEPGYWDVLASLIKQAKIQGAVIHDARIAALCKQHQVKALWTADRDFSRFSRLKVENPLR